jgi:hypothetical protein
MKENIMLKMFKEKFTAHLGVTSLLMYPGQIKKIRYDERNGEMEIWYLAIVNKPKYEREFEVHPTGSEIKSAWPRYIDTFFDGPYVWHLFENIFE